MGVLYAKKYTGLKKVRHRRHLLISAMKQSESKEEKYSMEY